MDGASMDWITCPGLTLDARRLERLDGMLGRLGLQFLGGPQVRHQRQVDAHQVLFGHLPLELPDRLDEGLRLHVAHRAADFRHDHVVLPGLAEEQHPAFDLVRDVGDDLDRLAQVGALAFPVDDRPVDLARRDVVRLRHVDAQEPFVVPEIQVGLGAVLRHIALAVLVRIQRSGVDVDVGIEFLDGDPQPSGLQELRQRSRNDAFAQGGGHAASNENVLCVHAEKDFLYWITKVGKEKGFVKSFRNFHEIRKY